MIGFPYMLFNKLIDRELIEFAKRVLWNHVMSIIMRGLDNVTIVSGWREYTNCFILN